MSNDGEIGETVHGQTIHDTTVSVVNANAKAQKVLVTVLVKSYTQRCATRYGKFIWVYP